MNLIMDFSELSKKLNKSDKATFFYAALKWLGVLESELEWLGGNSYNPAMRTLAVESRVIFVKEDEISEFFACNFDKLIPVLSRRTELKELGIDACFVLKMQYFYRKRELEKSGQPEDTVLFKETISEIGEPHTVLTADYKEYKRIAEQQ